MQVNQHEVKIFSGKNKEKYFMSSAVIFTCYAKHLDRICLQ